MATTRNGWDVYTSYSDPHLTNFPWVTGKVRKGDHYTVLEYIARRFNNEVEKINVAGSWGHNPRPVRGYTNVWSEHATGTAIDLNAPQHPIRVPASSTFSPAQIRRIRKIMRACKGSARWGGEWSRPDGMHFELIGGNAKVSAMANRIRKGSAGTSKPVTSSKPKPKGTDENRSIQTALAKMNLYHGIIDGKNGPVQKTAVKAFQDFHGLVTDGKWQKKTQAVFTLNKNVQKALRKQGYSKQGIDGYYGDQTAANIRDFQRRVGLKQDGLAGPATLKKLGL